MGQIWPVTYFCMAYKLKMFSILKRRKKEQQLQRCMWHTKPTIFTVWSFTVKDPNLEDLSKQEMNGETSVNGHGEHFIYLTVELSIKQR